MVGVTKKVIARLPFLVRLISCTEHEAETLMNSATDEDLWAIRDATRDILELRIPLTTAQREIFQPFVNEIRALGYASNMEQLKEVISTYFFRHLLLLQGLMAPVVEYAIEDPHCATSPRVTSALAFLVSLAKSTDNGASDLLKNATANQLLALRDATRDLLSLKVSLSDVQRQALQPFVNEVRALGYAPTLSDVRKVIREQFAGRLLLLQALIIPTIEQLEETISLPSAYDDEEE